MKPGCTLFFLLCSTLTITTVAYIQTPGTTTTVPYPLVGAPTFDLSIGQPREDFNGQNPSLPPNEFRAIDSSPDKTNLTRAASKISENLYASTVLERGTLKIKSVQITWLPAQRPEQKAAKAKAQAYMVAVIRTLTPLMTKTQNRKELQLPLTVGKNKCYYTEIEGALRYVIVNNGEKGLTFTVEPIKLTLFESLEGSNK